MAFSRRLLCWALILAAPTSPTLAAAARPAQSPLPAPKRPPTTEELEPVMVGLFTQSRFAEAEAQLSEHVKRAPRDPRVWNWLGVAQFAQKRYQASSVSFGKCVELGSAKLEVLTNLGISQFHSEQLEAARRTFARALELEPTSSRSHLFVARIELHEGNGELAEAAFRAAAASPAPDSTALFHYGAYLLQERRLAEAKAQLERALSLDPSYGSAHFSLGLVLQRLGDSAGAQRHLSQFKTLTEVSLGADRRRLRVTALLRATYRELEDGNAQAALSAALEAASEGPEFAVAHQTVADLYRRLGRISEADAAAARAAELNARAAAEARRAPGSGQ